MGEHDRNNPYKQTAHDIGKNPLGLQDYLNYIKRKMKETVTYDHTI